MKIEEFGYKVEISLFIQRKKVDDILSPFRHLPGPSGITFVDKIDAIKALRDAYPGLSIRDARDIVEDRGM